MVAGVLELQSGHIDGQLFLIRARLNEDRRALAPFGINGPRTVQRIIDPLARMDMQHHGKYEKKPFHF